MKKPFYMNDRTAILNYSAEYCQNCEDILSSEGFSVFIDKYLKNLAIRDINMFNWLTRGREMEEIIPGLIRLGKQLLVLDPEEIYDPLITDFNRIKLLFIVEDSYNFWRRKERFAILNANFANVIPYSNFIDADNHFDQLVIQLYRTCEEKLQGHKNKVYRQLRAGTNGCAVLKRYNWKGSGYNQLKQIPFINTMMLRAPVIINNQNEDNEYYPEEVDHDVVKSAAMKQQDWFCYPLKVGSLLGFVYFHMDYMSSGFALSNLYELASEKDCTDKKPDFICLYGKDDEAVRSEFHYDSDNDIWAGSVSYDETVDNFERLRKMILTLHNVRMMQLGSLPVHGSMVDIYFQNGHRRSIALVGSSTSGKREIIEAIRDLNHRDFGQAKISTMEIVFNEMGSFRVVDEHVYAQGTETGAAVSLDVLDKDMFYWDMDRSVIFNLESDDVTVVSPVNTYELIRKDHKIDMVLYINDYDEDIGVSRFRECKDALKVFKDGKRKGLDNNTEKVYFANPYGPLQQKELCSSIMEIVFEVLFRDDVYVGEIHTAGKPESTRKAAGVLLQIIKEYMNADNR